MNIEATNRIFWKSNILEQNTVSCQSQLKYDNEG